jgi:hypothetical protein
MEIESKSSGIMSFFTIVILGAVLGVSTGTALISSQALAIDFIPNPPAREEFFSPDRTYVFVLSTPDNWESRKAVGELFHVAADTRKLLWTRPLPHEFRPRYVLVGSKGQVLLLDEWVNIKSRYAVMVLNREDHLVAQHDFDAVQKVLGVPVARVVEMARHGWWIMSPPILDASGERTRVEAAGKVLTIRLSDGHLSVGQ